jgi:hypothetical protein
MDIFCLVFSYKVVLVISQVIGYMLGKFYGIRFIASLQPARRAKIILQLIFIAWVSLFLFAIVPAPYNFIFLFINGFPLAMVWGLVFGFSGRQEGNRNNGSRTGYEFYIRLRSCKNSGKMDHVEPSHQRMVDAFCCRCFIHCATINKHMAT